MKIAFNSGECNFQFHALSVHCILPFPTAFISFICEHQAISIVVIGIGHILHIPETLVGLHKTYTLYNMKKHTSYYTYKLIYKILC